MAVSLKKGQGVSLRKSEYDLSSVTIGLGWDCVDPSEKKFTTVEKKKSGLAGFFGSTEYVRVPIKHPEWDLDVIAFLCNESGKVINRGNNRLIGGDIIFFNNLNHSSGQIWLTGDNRDGSGDGDDEQIIANLNEIPEYIKKIAFIVHIYKGKENEQDFSGVSNAFIRAVDKNGKEMTRYDLSGGPTFVNKCSMIFAELNREGSDWKLNAIGEPFETDTFVDILRQKYL